MPPAIPRLSATGRERSPIAMLDLVYAFPGRTRFRRQLTITTCAKEVVFDHHLTKLIDLPTLEKLLTSIGVAPSRG